ncbi:MAG: hypothetical protein M5U28_42300 [Sandaracinaceae bacterium]|nr:hypothetical protein [Sandaracinaceae bacterium]
MHLYASADLHSADDVITANLHAWPVAAPVVPVVAPTSDHGDTLPEGLSCPWAAVRSSPAHETADELLRALRLATEGARAEVREPWLGRAALLLHGFAEAMTLTVGAAEELIDTASTRARRLGSATLVATLGAATFSFLTALPLALTWGAHALVTTSTLDDRMTLDSSVEAELPRFCAGPAIELASTGCRSSTRPTDVGGSR